MLCYHGSPRSYREPILATTPEVDLERMLAGSEAMLFAGGHTHIQLLRRSRNRLVINPGSVGMAFDPDPDAVLCPPKPWAEYAVLDFAQGRLSIDLRRISFDVEAVIQSGLRSGMPHAAWWAAQWRQSAHTEEELPCTS